MTEQNIANLLKQLRQTSTYSAAEVVEQLKKYNIEISAKTLYGYENGVSMLNADTFVALCKIYKCDNPMDVFGNVSFTSKEISIIEKYRALDATGKAHADNILEWETERIDKYNECATRNTNLDLSEPSTPLRLVPYYQKLASAGSGEVVFDDITDDRIKIPDIPKYRRVTYAITVNGRSMEPLYNDGDLLLVETVMQVERGEIGIFIIGDKAFVKKLGETELISLNKGYDNIPLTEDVKCMGRVVDKIVKKL